MARPALLRTPILFLVLLAAALTAGATWAAGSSPATVTLGSALANEPNGQSICSSIMTTRGCLAVDDVLPGRDLVAPSTGVIVAWHVLLGGETQAQSIRIRVVRRAGSTNQFTVISSGGLETVHAGAGVYTFPAQLPISPGDQVGLEADMGTTIGWRDRLTGANSFEFSASPPDGVPTFPPTFTNPNEEHSFNVTLDPTNTFSLGAVTRNKKKGAATLTVNVPNPGELTGSGKGVNAASAAVNSKTVTAPGSAQLLIKAKGKKKRKLNDTGKVKLNVAVTYTPTGGDLSTQSTKLKLKKL
jgi:hypothetical protein